MLSYQHKYHVGNHADVIKHLCWLNVIGYLNQKDKPYTLIDSHSGEGSYNINDVSNSEASTGIEKLKDLSSTDSALSTFANIIKDHAAQNMIPGSPAIAAALMRPQDSLHCIELHPQAFSNLQRFCKGAANLHCHKRDAYEGVSGLVPPKIKRGAILIDPPYEHIGEYGQVKTCIQAVLSRWPNVQILVWVPLLGARAMKKAQAANALLQHITTLPQDTCQAQLTIGNADDIEGMYGSVVAVINPYWTFAKDISNSLEIVAGHLGEHCLWKVS